MVKHRPIVFVDVETTGLSARDGRIIEVAAIRVENGKIVAEMSELVDPGVEISWFTTKLTGIRAEDLWKAPQFSAIAPRLEELLDGALFAAHNVDFDYGFIGEELKRVGTQLRMDRFCTARLSRALNPGIRGHSLDKLIERGGYDVAKRHRAYDDALVLHQFFQDGYEKHGLGIFETVHKITVYAKNERPKEVRSYPFFDV